MPQVDIIGYGVLNIDYVDKRQRIALAVSVYRLVDGYYARVLFPLAEKHQHFVFNAPGCICCKPDSLFAVERVDCLYKSDGSD